MLCRRKHLTLVVGLLILAMLSARFGFAMTVDPRSWSELIAEEQVACLIKCVSASAADKLGVRDIDFEVVDVLKTGPTIVKRGDRIRSCLIKYKLGALYFTLGSKNPQGPEIDWRVPDEATRAGFEYLRHAPAYSCSGKPQKRLAYFTRFLDSRDPFIASDVSREFDRAAFEDIAASVPQMHRQTLRKWFVDPNTPSKRMSLIGLLLGLCGDANDAKLLAAKIAEKNEEFRPGIEQVMSGYLLLSGSAGLDNLELGSSRTNLLISAKPTPPCCPSNLCGPGAKARLRKNGC